jgi:hypothetical protein
MNPPKILNIFDTPPTGGVPEDSHNWLPLKDIDCQQNQSDTENEIKKQLLLKSGKPFAPTAVARNLSITVDEVEELRQHHGLIGVPAEGYGYLYPAFQFREDGSVLVGLDKVLKALSHFSVWLQLQFLQTGDYRLEEATPIDALKQGKLDRALFAAKNYGEMRAA